MANKDDYLTSYREFFEYFAQTVNPNDQLPVKLGCYKLLNVEVVGGIIDWTTQYLTQKKCPPHLFSPLIKIIIDEIRKSCKKQPVHYGFNSTDNAYEPLKLMQAVMAKTNEVCLRYLDNSMLCSLPSPSNTYYETSICAIRNRRRKMEDRHIAIHDLNTTFNIQEASPSSYYAIFDGHAGHDAAAYSSAHLHQFLAENKYFMSNPEQALLDAFCKTDALFLEKCKVENLSGGTTAVVALLRPKEKTLYIAWVGDSQALLVKQGKILQCVNPHKPCREDERERIEKSGGCVLLYGTWRVNGQLAVSRAIGDADYKPHVIAIPDVREISLDGSEDFLIVACDGLWDYMSEDVAAQEVYYMVAENPDDTERISRHLAQLSCYQGSTDNISVIVVFLREPHKIAAEAHLWATRNGPPLTTDNMETGLDNANNPFTNSNGSLKNLDVETDNIHLQKSSDGLLLNLTDNFKANGTDLSKDIFEKSNGTKKSSSDIQFDDEFGPETDVDAVDDAFSPVEKDKTFADCLSKGFNDDGLPKSFNDEVKAFSEGLANNNPLGDGFNPFLNKVVEESGKEESKEDDFEEHGGDNREETPTPPVDTVHDVGGLEENPAESDSEDEWNYFKGDQAKSETLSSQPETVVETSEQEDAMSQLNPNAAEFVPVSPTRSIPSPACRALINDEVLAESPKRPVPVDIKVPNETEFESEVKSRPSDFDTYSNGHNCDSEHNFSGEMENILNGKSIDEIPEFQPGSTPAKQPLAEEFHFGPNAAPFTPKPLDQSEAFSTKANYGDDTEQTLNTSFNDSELAIPSKDLGDPMSMSFSAERGESNPFQDVEDLNKVHDLPEDLEEFLDKNGDDNKENRILDDTISDLPEHNVLGHILDNDQAAIQTTDLDKISQDDEKELASPLETSQDDFLDVERNIDAASRTPDSNLLEDFVVVPEKFLTDDSNISSLPELEPIPSILSEGEGVSPIPDLQPEFSDSRLSPLPGLLDLRPQEVQSISPPPESSSDLSESKSPLPVEDDLLQTTSPLPEEADLFQSKSPLPQEADLLQSKSPLPEEADLFQSKSPLPEEADLLQSKSPLPEEADLLQSKPPLPEEADLLQSKSPLPEEADLFQSNSPFPGETDLPQSKTPLLEDADLHQSKHPLLEEADLLQSISPNTEEADSLQSKSPILNQQEQEKMQEPIPELGLQDVEERQTEENHDLGRLESQSPICEFRSETRLPLDDFEESKSAVCELKPTSDMLETEFNPKSEVENILSEGSNLGLAEETMVSPVLACEFSANPVVCELQQHDAEAILPESHSPFELLHEQKHDEDITSSIKDDNSSPIELLSPVKSPEPVRSPELVKSPEPVVDELFVQEYLKQTDLVTATIEESPAAFSQEEQIQESIIQKEDVPNTEVPPQVLPSQDYLSDLICPVPASPPQTEIKPQFESELPVVENEPLFTSEQVQRNEITMLETSAPLESSNFTEWSNGSHNFASEVNEQFSIKTDNIKPEFAEPAIITPSDDSKVIDEIPVAPLSEVPVQEPPQLHVELAEPTVTTQETPKELPILAPLPIVPVAQETKEVKKEEKKSGTAAPGKKPIGKVAPSKSSTTPKAPATKASPKPAASSPKTGVAPRVPSKTGSLKSTTPVSKTMTSTSVATKPSPKPKTASAPKPTERKPLTNGDVKPAPRTTLTKRPSAEVAATKTTTRPATAVAKTSPSKTIAPRPTTAPRTAPLKSSTSTLTPRPASTTTSAARPKLPSASKTTHTSTAGTKLTASTTTKTTTTTATKASLSPRMGTAPPKPRTVTYTAPKPRVPLSKTITKSADVEKEKKESANKLTASRSTTVTKATSATATSRTATTTMKKTETKPLSHRTTTKTSTTTTKTTVSKKPGEIKSVTKTKTTKVEKPKENGVAPTNVTEEIKEITIINNLVNDTENLLKDHSPLDNKLITETTNALIDANPAD